MTDPVRLRFLVEVDGEKVVDIDKDVESVWADCHREHLRYSIDDQVHWEPTGDMTYTIKFRGKRNEA